MVNPLKVDPTRMVGIRKNLLRVVAEGWEVLGLRIQSHFKDNPYRLTTNAESGYSVDKLKRFRSWLRDKMDMVLAGDSLIEKYIEQGFDQGLNRSYRDSRKGRRLRTDLNEKAFHTLTKGKRVTVEKVNLLASRTFAEMEDVNTRTATKMSRILADGLVQGKTVDEVARELDRETDLGAGRAKVVARTELTRAHAEGQLLAMEELGFKTTRAILEFNTDGNACPQCSALDGKTYTIEAARGVIPVHPNCNCVWLPLD